MPDESIGDVGRVRTFVAGILLLWSTDASAGGFTFSSPGAIPMGRAGATVARGGMALVGFENPALLSDSRGSLDVELGLNLAFYEVCLQRFGDYAGETRVLPSLRDRVSEFGEWGSYVDEPFPEVCSTDGLSFIPYLAGTFRVHDRIGIGAGILPPLGMGGEDWGSSATGVNGDLRPQPNRYSYVRRSTLLIRGYLSVGARLTDGLRIGGGFVYGVTTIDTVVHQRIGGGEEPSTDIESSIEGADRFIPGFVASAHVNPHPNLDIALWYHWTDASRADGTLTLTSGIHGTGGPRSSVQATSEIGGVRLVTPQPRELRLAIRYADRRSDIETRRHSRDPLRDERWDIELDVGWVQSRHIDSFDVYVPEGNTIDILTVSADGTVTGGPNDVRTESIIRKGFRNQLTLALGADWAILPEVIAARLGVAFETSGVDATFAQTDFLPARRVSVHGGLTLRAGPVDVSLAYMHVFQEDVVATPEVAMLQQATTLPPAGVITNAGRYSLRFDAVSLGVAIRR